MPIFCQHEYCILQYMKIKKVFPFIVLTILSLIVAFAAGVRYGKSLQQYNAAVPNLQDSPEPSPTTAIHTPLEGHGSSYLLYQNEPCQIEFLYPDYLTVTETASDSAQLVSDQTIEMTVSCAPEIPQVDNPDKQILFKGNTISVKTIETNTQTVYAFVLLHPNSSKALYVYTRIEYLPLFERTLNYELTK